MAAEDGWGWFLEYTDRPGWSEPFPDLEHKTASGAGLVASCTLFTALYPVQTGGSGGACNVGGVAKSRIYQADFLTGAPNCAAGFRTPTGYQRFQERDVVAPPPEPSMVVQISKTPGSPPARRAASSAASSSWSWSRPR
jgi:type IV pilus assembly protein PilY1